MSAPDTNLEKQERRHRGPIWGILAALIVAGLLFMAFLAWTAEQSDEAGLVNGSVGVSVDN